MVRSVVALREDGMLHRTSQVCRKDGWANVYRDGSGVPVTTERWRSRMSMSRTFVMLVLVLGVIARILGWNGVLEDTFAAVVTAVCMVLALLFTLRGFWGPVDRLSGA